MKKIMYASCAFLALFTVKINSQTGDLNLQELIDLESPVVKEVQTVLENISTFFKPPGQNGERTYGNIPLPHESNLNFKKIVPIVRDFAIKISPEMSFEVIDERIFALLDDLPGAIIGYPVLINSKLSPAVINALLRPSQENKGTTLIESLHNSVVAAQPFAVYPKIGVPQLTHAIQSLPADTPASIQSTLAALDALVQKVIQSNNADDLTAVTALEVIINHGLDIIEKIYINRETLSDLLLVEDRRTYSFRIRKNEEFIDGFIERYLPELITLFKNGQRIRIQDLIAFKA